MGLIDLEEFASRETERGNRADSLRQSLARGMDQNPDEYAKALKLAAKTGVAPAWAKEFGPVIERQRKTDPFAVDELVKRNPKTAQFLGDPDNASVAHDDVENMSGIERALSYIVNPLRSFAAGFVDTPAQLVYGGLRASADVQSRLIGRPLASVVKGLTGYELADPFERMSRDFAELQRLSTAQRERIKGDLSKEHPLVQAAYSGFESAGGTLASLPYTLLTGGPGAMLGLMAGSSGGRSYGEARQKGVPVEQALTYAGSQALIEYATELIPAKALIRDLGLHTNILKTLGNQIWRENIGEQVATALQDLNEWAILNPEKPFNAYLAERPSAALQTFVATMVGTTVQTAAAKGMDTAMMGQEHRANRRVFEALGQLSQESKLRSRIPEKFRNFIEQATEDGPVKDVLVPVAEFDRYFQTQEMDPATVAQQLGAANYMEAKLAGTDVAIPIAEFAEKIAPTPHLQGLAEDLRLKPGELTEREAKENAEAFKTEQTERANKILEQQAEAQPLETAIQLITENVQAQLEAAGMEPSTARDQAAVMRGIAVVASRANPDMNPLQAAARAWERYGLSVQSPTAQPETVDVEGARRDAETLAKLREAGPIGRTDQKALGAAIDDHIRAMAATEGGVTYNGKTYEKAVKDGNNLKLLSGDEEIMVRGAEIMKVEEVVPFDVEASDYVKRFFQATGGPHVFFQSPQVDTDAFKTWFRSSKVVNENGDPLVVYHGTGRPDRVGTTFRKSRATSGPMSFFSDNPEVASSYALQKADTSLEQPADYAEWFKFKPQGSRSEVDIDRAWYFLTQEQRQAVTEKLPHVINLDAEGNEIEGYRLDETEHGLSGKDHWDYEIKQARGNVLKAAKEIWLNGGNLVGSEAEFMKILQLGGMPMDQTRYDDPRATSPFVYPVYLSIQNPLVTDAIPQNVIDELEKTARRSRTRPQSGTDAWDKRSRDLREWVAQLKDDIANNRNSFVWTSIPDPISETLKRLGYDGIQDVGGKSGGEEHAVWIPFEETQVKSVFNRGTFDPSNRNIMRQEDDEKKARAFIEIGGDRQVTINLLENRDLSSFLHETGHLYLELLGDFAQAQATSEQVKADYQTVLNWLGRKDRGEITTEDHEKVARGFEQYLREGKAPSVELRSVFQRFKAWLMMIYRQAKDLRVQLNDDVREVFDRILASDQEIEFAKAQIETRPMFTDAKAAGMTEHEFNLYTKAVGDEVETAKDRLQVQLMREYDREQSKQYKAEIAKVKKELEAEADALPIYTALAALSAGKLPDDTPVKLNRASVAQKYTKAIADKLPKKILTNSGNLDAESAASIFGFATGDDLIKAFAEMESRQDYIDRRAVETMRERYGDIRTDGTIADRAVDALHNDQRAKVIRMELQAIRRRQSEVEEIKGPLDKARRQAARAAADVPSEKVFRDTARDIIQHIAVRNLEPYRYLQAERRAARGAINAMAAEDFETAHENKRQELLSHYLYMEAENAREEADEILDYARKFEQRKARESLGKAGADYLAQVDHLLNRYEFRKVPITQLERRQALSEWIQSQIDDGLEPSIDERLLDETRRTNYRDVSIDELRAVRDALKNIEHLSRLKNKLVYRKKQADFRDAKDALIASAEENFDREPLPFSKDAETLRERGLDTLKGFDAGLIKPERLFMWLDGNDVNGPWHQYVWNPLKESQHHENDLTKTITTKLVSALEKMPKKQRETMHDVFHVDGIGRLTRKDIISIAFNRGNAENLDKMLRGMQWNQGIVDRALAKLNAADWKFIQETWDVINELWPEIAELQKRTTGLEPKKVEALPFKAYDEQGNEIADLRGGYFPLVYDSRFSSAGKRQEMGGGLGQIFEEGYVRATTPKGHTQERTGFAAPLLFDFEAVITSHIAKVIRDVTHRESIIAANKVLSDQEIRSVLQETLGEAYEQTMQPWLRYIANERSRSIADGLSTWERLFTAGRANTVAATMGFKATTMLAQMFSLSNSMDAVKPSYLAGALGEYMRSPIETTQTVNDLSGEMRHRANTMDRDINQRLQQLIGKQSPLVAVQRFAYHGIAAMDSIVARVTWLGAYRQALAEGKDAEAAINSGDAAVRLTQGAGSSMDLAAIQRSRDNFWRATTMFYSFFSALYSQGRDIGFQVESKGDLPRALARYFFAFALPAILGDLIVLRGPDDDKDESWAWWMLRKAMIQPLMTVPLLRDLANHFDSGYDIRITPITAVYEKLTRLVDRAYKDQVDGNDIDFLKYAENVAETVGYMFGVPGTAQVMGTERYLRRLGEGEEDPDNLLQLMYESAIGKRRD